MRVRLLNLSETKNPGDKTLSVDRKKTLSLSGRNVEQGTVRQSFSHGRTKAVVVEKKKRRMLGPGQSEDERAAQVVKLRYFAGLTIQQTAEALGISVDSVNQNWAFARATLYHTTYGDAPHES